MTAACSHGVAAESWIDFFASELDDEAGERLERLLFECTQCAAEAERWGAVAGATGLVIPPVLTPEALRALQNQGELMNENVMQPGDHRRAEFPDGGRLLIHRLEGLELGPDDRIDLALSTPEGAPLVRFEDVPFDRDTGEVLVACQRHFGESFPEKIVFEIERRVADQVEVLATYSVDHTY
ncbi:MAG: hypothetical protein JRE45_18575 [Deltaproteobacteria bacterium]|nr:hypothetical protein [Deltaproteobacteria bacterium]